MARVGWFRLSVFEFSRRLISANPNEHICLNFEIA